MLNLQFAQVMDLTEAELLEVKGGLLYEGCPACGAGMGGLGVRGIYPGWGGQGLSPQKGAFSWLGQLYPTFDRTKP